MVERYQIIYADPPWSYQNEHNPGRSGASYHYPTLCTDKLKSIPVGNIAANDSVLFIWVTMPKLNEVFGVIDVWGFKYKTVAFTWVKRNRKSPTWFWGMGRWTRSNAELCLIATKGHPKRISASIHSIIDTPIERHSKKPDVTRQLIVSLVGDLRRVELFARQRVRGWDVWGNEVESDLKLVA